MVREFNGVILEGLRGGALIEIPFDVIEAFGKSRVMVKATFDKVEYRGFIVKMGGKHILGIRKEIRSAIGKDIGDNVRVTVEEDTAPREVQIPNDFQKGLINEPLAFKFFNTLSYTHRKEYTRWIVEAKKPETRARRIKKAIEMLLDKKSR